VQVAHSEESAQAIFNIVHRFWENLPNKRVRRGALVKSRSNVRQIVFPRLDSEYRVETADDNAGRGMTIHNLHCSEVSRWPRDGGEILASLRRRWCRTERLCWSRQQTAQRGFLRGVAEAQETGYARHFFRGGMRRPIRRMRS